MAIPSGRDPPCVVHRASRSGRACLRARPGDDRYPGIGRDHPRDGCAARLPAATVHTTMEPPARIVDPRPPGGRARPCASALAANPLVVDTAIALFLAALSLLAYVGAAPYVGPLSGVTPGAPAPREPAADRPPPVPARGPGRDRGRVDPPPRAPPRGPVTDGRASASSSPSTPSASVLDRRTSLTATALTAALLAVVFVGRAGIAAVARCRSSRPS